MLETETFYRARDADTEELWCESRDPDDPYLLPSRPDQRLLYSKIEITYVPHTRVSAFQPSPAVQAKGHPATWDDD